MAQCLEARRLWFPFAEPSPGREATKSLCVCVPREERPAPVLRPAFCLSRDRLDRPKEAVASGPLGVAPGSTFLMLGPRLSGSTAELGLQASWCLLWLGRVSTEVIKETIFRDLFALKVEL